jgi:putative transposase
MTAPLSQDLRERLVRVVEQGSSARAAARRFDPSWTVKAAVRRFSGGKPMILLIGGWRHAALWC